VQSDRALDCTGGPAGVLKIVSGRADTRFSSVNVRPQTADRHRTRRDDASAAGACVLLAEDNTLNADMLSRRLTRSGYRVLVVTDGLMAVERAGIEHPDLILMDIGLPEIDGWEATRRLKAAPDTAHIPVIALTAHALVFDREASLAAGCDEFETKPIDFTRLLDKMARLLQPQESLA
jgi:CheY-like chemotaxis protein